MKKKYKTAFGIANHLGGLWTNETFDTAEDAQSYIDQQQARSKSWNLSDHKPVLVEIRIAKPKRKEK